MPRRSSRRFVYYQFLILGVFISLTFLNEALDISHYLFGDAPTQLSQRVGEVAIEIAVAVLVVAAEVRFINQLRRDIRVLEGFIPICANCKKVRTLRVWKALERYIEEHSFAQFTHAICPDCVRQLYPEMAEQILLSLDSESRALNSEAD
jgi:hypothetical protein